MSGDRLESLIDRMFGTPVVGEESQESVFDALVREPGVVARVRQRLRAPGKVVEGRKFSSFMAELP